MQNSKYFGGLTIEGVCGFHTDLYDSMEWHSFEFTEIAYLIPRSY
jgi:hypothetical protein